MTKTITFERKVEYYAAVLSTFWLFGLALTFQYIWTIAFLRGGTTRVSVNQFGEQYVELVLLFGVVWPIILYGTYRTMKLMNADWWLTNTTEGDP